MNLIDKKYQYNPVPGSFRTLLQTMTDTGTRQTAPRVKLRWPGRVAPLHDIAVSTWQTIKNAPCWAAHDAVNRLK